MEWLGRFWVSKNKLKFIFSPLSIIDLLSILPSYRPLRFLRFLLLFRLLKIFRYTRNVNYLFKVFTEKKFEFLLLFTVFAFLVFFAATSLYIFEGQGENHNVRHYYDALYWSIVTISTVGFGDISPITSEGRFITIVLIVAGIMLISFLTSIVTTAMSEKLDLIKENDILHQVRRLKSYVLIFGYGNMATTTLELLGYPPSQVVIIDNDEEKINNALHKNYLALKADATKSDILTEIEMVTKASHIFIFIKDDAINLSVSLSVRSLAPNITVFSRVMHTSMIKKLKSIGVHKVINPSKLSAETLYDYILDKKYETIILSDSGLSRELKNIFIKYGKKIVFLENIDYHDEQILIKHGVEKGHKNILCLSGDFNVNLFMTMNAKMLNSTNKVVTKVYDKAQTKKILLAGGDSIINPYIIGAKHIQECLNE